MSYTIELGKRIDEILALCQIAQEMVGRFGSVEHRAAETKFLEALTALDREAFSGPVTLNGNDKSRCVIGRLVRLGVADGYAYYIILKVNKRTVRLIHVPYGDAYKSHIVDDNGEADRSEIEDIVDWHDTITAAFEKSSQRVAEVTALIGEMNQSPALPVVEMDAETAEAVAREFANNL